MARKKQNGGLTVLTKKQLSSVMINAIILKMIMTFPRNIFMICGNSAWMAGIAATAVSFGLFCLIKWLYCAKSNVIDISYKLGGVMLRTITGLCVFLVLSLNFISILRIFPEIIHLVLLQKTYVEFITAAFVITVIYGSWCGIEAIARVHQIFIPIAGVVFASFIIMLLPDIKGGNLLPIFGNGTVSLIKGSLFVMSIFSDLLMLNILIPFAKDPDDWKGAGNKSIIIGGVCAILIFLAYGMCYAYPASSEFIVPIYQLERLINLSDFFSRLETVFQFIWSISILLYSSMYLAVLGETWRESFGLHHTKPLCAPITIALVGVALLPDSLNDAIFWDGAINRWVYIPAFAIPVIIGALFHVKQFKTTR